MTAISMTDFLPSDWRQGVFAGRLWLRAGPTPILVRGGAVYDVSRAAPTVADLLGLPELPDGEPLGPVTDFAFAPHWSASFDAEAPRLLAPIDLQCVKACGVTFAVSAIERVIEERCRGDASEAEAIRGRLAARVGAELGAVLPGTDEAMKLKGILIQDGLWSQYLEVAIGPDAEVFTKQPLLSTVGWGEYVGVRADSAWNNPEPEVVLVCDAQGRARGATLGNDVNLRDFEGRSALLLGKAKDNNASGSMGPLIRIFGEGFTMDDVRETTVRMEVEGEDGFTLEASSSMGLISRDPEALVKQTCGANHSYPDGFALYLGTMFAPTQDRDAEGGGFTHKPGDMVRISAPKLGVLENKVTTCDKAPAWTFGVTALMRNLASRGLLRS